MATTDLYTNEMISDLKDKIDSVVVAVDAMITELQNINIGVAQSVQALAVKDGTNESFDLGNVEKSGNTTPVSVGKIKVFGNGVVRVSANLKVTGAYIASLKYSINGAASVDLMTTTATSFTAISKGLSVKALDVIEFFVGSTGPGAYYGTVGPNVMITYDVYDIINNGVVIPVV